MKSSNLVLALASESPLAEDDAEGTALYPVRFLGMGLLIAWLCCTHVVDIFPGNGSNLALRNAFDIGMRFGDIGTFILFGLVATKIGPLSKHHKLNAVSAGITTLGTLFVGLILIPGQFPEPLVIGVAFFTAIGGAFLFCLWAEAYCQMGNTQTLVYGALSCITAAVTYLIISTMMAPYTIIATSLLPLASLACVVLSFKLLPVEHKTTPNIHFPIPWKLILLMAFAGLMSGMAGFFIAGETDTGAIHRVLATGLAGLVIIAMVITLKDRCDVRFLAKIGLPISIIALAIIPFAIPEWGVFVSILIKLAYVWFTFFVLLMLANIAFRFEVPSLRLFALARASSESAIFVGVILRRTLIGSALTESDMVSYTITLIGLVLLLICVLVWISEKSVNADWGASGIGVENHLHIPGPREQLIMRCEALATSYGLTARETEILGLIAQRKSRIEIEQKLFLSQNTVKTHVRHIYAKLKIHSKSDVYQLFESNTHG